MAIMLAAASIYVELKLVKSVPGLKKLVERFGFVGLVMSLALSVILGGIFGAAGVTIMLAGMCSTMVTAPLYRLRGEYQKKNEKIHSKIVMAQQGYTDFKRTYRPVGKTLKWTAIGVTSPVWGPVWINNKMRAKQS